MSFYFIGAGQGEGDQEGSVVLHPGESSQVSHSFTRLPSKILNSLVQAIRLPSNIHEHEFKIKFMQRKF